MVLRLLLASALVLMSVVNDTAGFYLGSFGSSDAYAGDQRAGVVTTQFTIL